MSALPVALSLLACPAPAAPADVWEVGGAGLATIGDAIALAADGDVVLVHPGTYPGFTVAGKSLVIVGDGDTVPVVDGPVVVYGLAADQGIALQGLRIQGDYLDAALRATANDGAVWIEDCSIRATGGIIWPNESLALQAVDCASLVVRRSTITGGFGGYEFGGGGGKGALVRESTASFFDCAIAGGEGGWSGLLKGSCENYEGMSGGVGLWVESSDVLLHGSAVVGGMGGVGDWCSYTKFLCGDGGPGGTGLFTAGAGQVVRIGTTIEGGAGGYPGSLACAYGPDGDAQEILGLTPPLALDATPVSLASASPLREGEHAATVASGEPGALLAVLASSDVMASGGIEGAVGLPLIAQPPILLGTAVLPPGGSAIFQAPVPELGAGVDAFPLRLQAVQLTGAGELVLGEVATLVLLDGAF